MDDGSRRRSRLWLDFFFFYDRVLESWHLFNGSVYHFWFEVFCESIGKAIDLVLKVLNRLLNGVFFECVVGHCHKNLLKVVGELIKLVVFGLFELFLDLGKASRIFTDVEEVIDTILGDIFSREERIYVGLSLQLPHELPQPLVLLLTVQFHIMLFYRARKIAIIRQSPQLDCTSSKIVCGPHQSPKA
jgi:hypothetical protein